MRGAVKLADSKILSKALTYKKGDSRNNLKITNILMEEHYGFCAYTDEFISITDAKDVEHFNPTLKYTPSDNYQNWFFVKHKWNTLKSTKWNDYQPILYPTSPDFEQRVVYIDGEYLPSSISDIESQNLISLLKLDNAALAKKRKQYIKRKRDEMVAFDQTPLTFFSNLVKADPCQVHYSRAIKEEFGIDVFEILG
jgi:hypothetical protein